MNPIVLTNIIYYIFGVLTLPAILAVVMAIGFVRVEVDKVSSKL